MCTVVLLKPPLKRDSPPGRASTYHGSCEVSGSTGLLLREREGEGEGGCGQQQQGGEPAHGGWTAASPRLVG